MIYLDTSVALAHLLAEDRRVPERLWTETLVASRLLDYELWNRLHRLGAAQSHGDAARDLLARVAIVELAPEVLARALEPFPAPVRTLDALHLASAEYLRAASAKIEIATYDDSMATAAKALGFVVIA
ncbi:MAG: PIN domain-containing protein [Thermoanaerobaculia bacterium]